MNKWQPTLRLFLFGLFLAVDGLVISMVSPSLVYSQDGVGSWVKSLPDRASGVIVVDDYDAAKRWQREHCDGDDRDLRQRFALPDLPDGIGSAARVFFASEDSPDSEALVFVAISDAVAEKVVRLIDPSSGFATQPQVLARRADADRPSTVVHANRGRVFSVAQSESVAVALLNQDVSNSLGDTLVSEVNDFNSHLLLPMTDSVVNVKSAFSFADYWTSPESLPWRKRHGLNVLQQFVSTSELSADGETQTLGHLKIEGPRESSLGIFELLNDTEVQCPRWISSISSQKVILRVDLSQSLRRFGALFDDLYARGITGTYHDILADVKSPDGLNIDIESDLFDQLGTICVLGTLDVTAPNQDGNYIAMEVREKQAGRVAGIIEELVKDDPGVVKTEIEDASFPLWSFVSENDSPTQNDPRTGIMVLNDWVVFAHDDRTITSLFRERRKTNDNERGQRFAIPSAENKPFGFGAIACTPALKDGQQGVDPLTPFFFGQAPHKDQRPATESPFEWFRQVTGQFSFPNGQTWVRNEEKGWLFFSLNASRQKTYFADDETQNKSEIQP